MTTTQSRPSLVIYKEIVAGDIRKLLAESNDSPTGGGARDLRFPARGFDAAMRQIFTTHAVGRGGRPIRVADVIYLDPQGRPDSTQIEYWPATSARPSEVRVARIHASPALGGQMPRTDKGRVFVLFIKFSGGIVRCTYAYEHDLKASGIWAQEVSSAILGCMASADLKNGNRSWNLVTVQGYYDFTNGTGYCHAD